MLGVWQGSAAQQAQELVPDGVAVVGALHTVSAAILGDLDHALDEDVLLVGDRRADKARVAALLERIEGLRCVDAGRLEMARITESLTALMIAINIRLQDTRRNPPHRAPRHALVSVVLLSGGTGGAKLARGLYELLGDELAVIANTGDDIEIYGAYVSPDPDLVTYWLADRIDERGWGIDGDSFAAMEMLASSASRSGSTSATATSRCASSAVACSTTARRSARRTPR